MYHCIIQLKDRQIIVSAVPSSKNSKKCTWKSVGFNFAAFLESIGLIPVTKKWTGVSAGPSGSAGPWASQFFPGRPNSGFFQGGQKWWNFMLPTRNQENNIFCKRFNGNMSNFKMQGSNALASLLTAMRGICFHVHMIKPVVFTKYVF